MPSWREFDRTWAVWLWNMNIWQLLQWRFYVWKSTEKNQSDNSCTTAHQASEPKSPQHYMTAVSLQSFTPSYSKVPRHSSQITIKKQNQPCISPVPTKATQSTPGQHVQAQIYFHTLNFNKGMTFVSALPQWLREIFFKHNLWRHYKFNHSKQTQHTATALCAPAQPAGGEARHMSGCSPTAEGALDPPPKVSFFLEGRYLHILKK